MSEITLSRVTFNYIVLAYTQLDICALCCVIHCPITNRVVSCRTHNIIRDFDSNRIKIRYFDFF